MLLSSYISSKEEKAMGISPEAIVEYQFGMMKSDDPALEAYENSNPLLKPKRKQSISCHATNEKNQTIFIGLIFLL
jgi:hypothetical protein